MNLEKAGGMVEEESRELDEKSSELNSLPDEVLILIFNQVLELKWLFWCSLVSKRFASLIPLVHAVSFTCPQMLKSAANSSQTKPMNSLFKDAVARQLNKCFCSRRSDTKRLPSSTNVDAIHSALRFLVRFREVRYLRMEINSRCRGQSNDDAADDDGKLLYKWRVKFGTKLETLVFVSPTSLREMKVNGEEGRHTGGGFGIIRRDNLQKRANYAFGCLKEAFSFHTLLLHVIFYHRMLRSVVLTDTKKQGSVCVMNEELLELRNYMDSLTLTEFTSNLLERSEVPVSVKLWFVPVLPLPLSGFVMEGLIMVMVRLADPKENSDVDDDGAAAIAAAAFGEGEEAYGEAVTEVMLNHKEKLKTIL